jgi:galactokinase
LDLLIDSVKNNPNVLGGRMMGGGFGGCTINIIRDEEIPFVINELKEIYQTSTGLQLEVIKVETVNGTELLA